MQTSDESLLARVADGDVAAFAQFYDCYGPRVLGLIAKMLGHADDAEDVLQEVFCQVWSSACEYDVRRASPAAWVFMIARSRACDALRRRRAVAHFSAEAAASADGQASQTPGPCQQLEKLETGRAVHDALDQLSEEQRSAIQLAFYGGMTHAEVAMIQDVPLGTAKTRIRLGMRRLRELLSEREKVPSS